MRPAPSVRVALVLAAAGHLLVVGALRLVPVPSRPSAASAVPVVEIALDEAPGAPEPSTGRGARLPTASVADRHSGAGATPRAAEPATPLESGASTEASAADRSWSFDPTRPSPAEIGIGSHWKSVVADGAARETAISAEAEARGAARALGESMSGMLAERDVALGLGRGGPLVTAAREAASSPDAPAVGTTILEVDWDAAGSVVAARADDHAWNAVAAAIVRRMAGKPLRVRPGARGMRARLRVVAEQTLPAGTRKTSAPGAVPDDIAGGDKKVCEGEGSARRCLAGMPVGVTSSVGDISNTGARLFRIVHAELLGEAAL